MSTPFVNLYRRGIDLYANNDKIISSTTFSTQFALDFSNNINGIKTLISSDASVNGPQGPAGNNGAQGPQGNNGTNGSQGPQGNNGQGFTYQGSWAMCTQYNINDVVTYNGTSYVSIQLENVGESPDTSNTYWSIFAQGLYYQGSWNQSNQYNINDIVTYNGSSYICIQLNNIFQEPDTSPSYWSAFALQGSQGPQGDPGTPVTDISRNNIFQGKLTTSASILKETDGQVTDTIIPFVPDIDPNGWMANDGNHRFQPNILGYYLINAYLNLSPSTQSITGQINLQMRKNDSTFGIFFTDLPIVTAQTVGGSKIVYLNGSTDFVTFTGYTSDSSNNQIVTTDSHFSASLCL